jgi:18S rRNA (guanine1575-N7)-methyltransferase
MLVAAAMRVGFSGGLVLDYPHSTRAKKYFLVLMVGAGGYAPQGKDGEPGDSGDEAGPAGPAHVAVAGRERRGGKRKGPPGGGASAKDRAWVVKKKDKLRRKGHEVKPDTKYTARKRRRVV